jgi:hypothetical protein
MKYLIMAAAAALMAAGCASSPDTPETSGRTVDCRNVDAPTGSRLIRRSDCVAVPPATTTQAPASAPKQN